jgi:GT2 family glycosyltransferase
MDKVWAVVPIYYPDPTNFKKLLDALSGQTYPLDRIFIVDNGVPYNSYMKVLSTPNTWVERMPQNLGSAGGFAWGMQCAYDCGADWIWLHDEDDWPEPDCLEKMIMPYWDSPELRVPVISDPDTGKVIHRNMKKNGIWGNYYPAGYWIDFTDMAPSSGLLIHRDVIADIGVYDPSYFIGHDDHDYCLRANKAGYRIAVVHNAHFHHPEKEMFRLLPSIDTEKLRKYLPNFWGAIRKQDLGNWRSKYIPHNYIKLTKKYKPWYIVLLEGVFSVILLNILKLAFPTVRYRETLKVYWKSYWSK